MMCGYTSFKPSPPPSSQDWDANNPGNAVPKNDMGGGESVNLKGTSCDFATMNRKLYNQVKSSKGTLWVNSFRFGVGQSFSDYEQARYFFPPSDSLCTENPIGTIDRFTNYLESGQWCAPTSTYYVCSKNQFGATDRDTCLLYCKNDQTDCQLAQPTGGPAQGMPLWFECPSNHFAYEKEDACKRECPLVDEGSCTDNTADYPFLEQGARYKTKYTADFMVDAWNPNHGDSKKEMDESLQDVCRTRIVSGAEENPASVPCWDAGSHWFCNDFSPWAGCENYVGATLDAFAVKKSGNVVLDNERYSQELVADAPAGSSPDNPYPFECVHSTDCISGYCDPTYHSRTLLKKVDGSTIAAGCTFEKDAQQKGYLDCTAGFSPAQQDTFQWLWEMDYDFSAWTGSWLYDGYEVVPTSGLLFNRAGPEGNELVYGYFVPSDPGNQNDFFTRCQIPQWQPWNGNPQQSPPASGYCLYTFFNDNDGSPRYLLLNLPAGEECPYDSVYYNKPTTQGVKILPNPYINPDPKTEYLTHPTSDRKYFLFPQFEYSRQFNYYQRNMEDEPRSWGICALTDNPQRPYMDHIETGWCAGCTYATLAVQKVGWGLKSALNPYGYDGYLRPYTCYEWEGTADYSPEAASRPDLNLCNFMFKTSDCTTLARDAAGVPGPAASTDAVRKYSNAELGPTSGNIERAGWASYFWGGSFGGYYCMDGWQDPTSWRLREAVPNPSAPFLRGKLQSYLSSNIMPILDVAPTRGGAYISGFNFGSRPCPYCPPSFSPIFSNRYPPTDICTSYQADGAIIYDVGNTDMLRAGSWGSIAKEQGLFWTDFESYIQASIDPYKDNIDGKTAIMARAQMLKKKCEHPPLVAMEVKGDLSDLIGKDLMERDSAQRGPLHRFFYNSPNTVEYLWRVKNAKPDQFPDNVDMFLLEWQPACGDCTTAGCDNSLEARTGREFNRTLDYSRALLSNFSKPSLVWRFHFPDDSECHEPNQPQNYDYFTDYVFNHTGDMVDAGMMGLVYDSWLTESGKPFGNPDMDMIDTDIHSGNTASGFDNALAEGALDAPPSGSKSKTPFCSVQKFAQKVIGLEKMTYGQKVFGKPEICECAECTDRDYSMGACDRNAQNLPGLPQLVCNDGSPCELPDGASDYHKYFCPHTCLNSAECESCADSPEASFCRIERTGRQPTGETKNLAALDDLYWEFIAGLPKEEKCCLVQENAESGDEAKYTYVERTGSKQRSEFLQFPTRGEQGIDCGRVPDTSVLKYCGITIPISQLQVDCNRVQGVP
jgi:hypothetical protein